MKLDLVVSISLPELTTPASSLFISRFTPSVISGRTTTVTASSIKSAKSSNMIIIFPPDQVKGAKYWYFQQMKKKVHVELRMKKKKE